MGLKEYTISLIMIGLFSIAIIGFAIGFASDNNAPIDISNSNLATDLNTNIKTNLTNYASESESTYQSIVDSSIDEGETTPTGGQFTLTIGNALGVITSIVNNAFVEIFGGNESSNSFYIFLTTFIGMLVMLSAYYIWKAWAGRSVE